MSSQLRDLSQSLRALSGKLPCAAYAQSEMGKRVLQSPVLRAIAYADGTRIVCSSLGRTLDGLDLGPPDFVSLQGMRVWPDVALPAAPELRYIALSFNGYTIFLNRGDYVNAMTLLEPSATIGLFYPGETNRFFGIGYVKPEWLQSAATRQAVVGELSGTVLAILPSSRFQHVAVVAIPRCVPARLRGHAMGGRGGRRGRRRDAVRRDPVAQAMGPRHAPAAAPGDTGPGVPSGLPAHRRYPDQAMDRRGGAAAMEAPLWRRADGAGHLHTGGRALRPVREIAALVFDLVAEDLPIIESHVRGFYVSLNISANEVKSGSGRALAERLLQETGLPPSWIIIELTERGLLEENARKP